MDKHFNKQISVHSLQGQPPQQLTLETSKADMHHVILHTLIEGAHTDQPAANHLIQRLSEGWTYIKI